MIEEVNDNIWGEGYKVVVKKLDLRPKTTLTDQEQMGHAMDLFPRYEKVQWEPVTQPEIL